MAAKKRGPKPKADWDKSAAVFSTRMPTELRRKLEAAAEAKGRKLSPEIIHRLQQSFYKVEKDPYLRALFYLLGQLAWATAPEGNLHADVARFRAFRAGAFRLLDYLTPEAPHPQDQVTKNSETYGFLAADAIWAAVQIPERKPTGRQAAEIDDDWSYSMVQARRDLGMNYDPERARAAWTKIAALRAELAKTEGEPK